MRLLANENFPGLAVAALREAGHDVAWVHEDAPGTPDPEVRRRGQHERRILLTFDKDFGELAFRRGADASAGVVLFRVTLSSPEQAAAIAVLALSSDLSWIGHFAVVEDDRVRLRPLPTRTPHHGE
jgi:predicted nuclease of predicted toxin-antitoxin system